MIHENTEAQNVYAPASSTRCKQTTVNATPKYLNKRKLKRKARTRRVKRGVLLLIVILSFFSAKRLFQQLEFPLSDSHHTYASYKQLLNEPLAKITETLSSAEQSNPIFLSLIDEATTYPEAKILLANHDAYPEILLELASNRPETLEFVIDYPNYQPSENKSSISIRKDYKSGSIPLFIQWDKRWGYEAYGDEFIASSACGPTALSMVVVGLTGNTDLHPKAVADFSYESGYFHSGQGTSWALMSEGAERLGLTSTELPLDANRIMRTLENGQPIILSMRPGHFTQSGHFIVLTGIASDGSIQVNDPGSIQNSQITWDLDILMNETKNLWAFSAT